MADAQDASIGRAMLARFATALRGVVRGDGITDAVRAIRTTRLVPLWYAPLLFCGDPLDPNKLPESAMFGRCVIRWAELIGRAVERGELLAREPDGWSVIEDIQTVTPDCLVYWGELEQWSMDHHGLSAGCPTLEEVRNEVRNPTVTGNDNSGWRKDPTMLKSAKQERAVLAVIEAKRWPPLAVPDGEKGTIESLCRLEYPELFGGTSTFNETWKRGLRKGHWRMQSHASYAKRGRE